MGMYDTINGEQVKCFPWVSLYDGSISYHGGDLQYYGTGDKVPYRRPHYNYGKNFVILDLNRYPEWYLHPYDYILHVIMDGKVKDTYKDRIGEIDWSIVQSVVGYTGELLNIHSDEDVLNYIKDQREYWRKNEEINKHKDELFAESMKYFHGIGTLDKNSEERKIRLQKIKEIQKLMDEERKRIMPEQLALTEEYSRLFVNTYDDLIYLGNYIAACDTEARLKSSENEEKCLDMIRKLLSEDETLYDRYVEWQGSDVYIMEFKIS